MKTEIKQSEPEFLIRIEDRPKGLMIVQEDDNWVYVEKENLRELALILCPDLSQPELKAVKTADTKPSDKFIAFVKRKYEQKDHNTMYLFDNMIDAIYQGVLCQLINECFEPKEEQPEKIVSELQKDELIHKLLSDKADLNETVSRQSKQIEELKSEVEKAKEIIGNALANNEQYGYLCSDTISEANEFLEGTKTK